MGFLQNIFGGGIADVVKTVGNAVDGIIVTPQDKFDWLQKQAEEEWRFKTLESENFQKEQDRVQHYYELDQKDRDSARELGKVELQSNDVFVRRFKYYFAAMVTVLIMVFLGIILFHKIPSDARDVVMVILGSLTGILSTIVAYFFGSSQGSAVKTELISKELNKQTDESLGKS